MYTYMHINIISQDAAPPAASSKTLLGKIRYGRFP